MQKSRLFYSYTICFIHWIKYSIIFFDPQISVQIFYISNAVFCKVFCQENPFRVKNQIHSLKIDERISIFLGFGWQKTGQRTLVMHITAIRYVFPGILINWLLFDAFIQRHSRFPCAWCRWLVQLIHIRRKWWWLSHQGVWFICEAASMWRKHQSSDAFEKCFELVTITHVMRKAYLRFSHKIGRKSNASQFIHRQSEWYIEFEETICSAAEISVFVRSATRLKIIPPAAIRDSSARLLTIADEPESDTS